MKTLNVTPRPILPVKRLGRKWPVIIFSDFFYRERDIDREGKREKEIDREGIRERERVLCVPGWHRCCGCLS